MKVTPIAIDARIHNHQIYRAGSFVGGMCLVLSKMKVNDVIELTSARDLTGEQQSLSKIRNAASQAAKALSVNVSVREKDGEIRIYHYGQSSEVTIDNESTLSVSELNTGKWKKVIHMVTPSDKELGSNGKPKEITNGIDFFWVWYTKEGSKPALFQGKKANVNWNHVTHWMEVKIQVPTSPLK